MQSKRIAMVWIPSLLGLGSRIENDYSGLTRFLAKELETNLENLPVRFQQPYKNMLMKTLQSGNSFITIIVNKNESALEISLKVQQKDLNPILIYSNNPIEFRDSDLMILPEETVVICWK